MNRPACAALYSVALITLALSPSAARSADDPRPFSQSLDAAEKQRLGLAALTPAQLVALDAAVAAYTRGENAVAVRQAVAQAEQQSAVKVQQAEQKAAVTAVEEYKKKQEPGAIARTLDAVKRQQEKTLRQRFTAHVVGEFRGWSGGTSFPLTDGQVWHQVGADRYEIPPVPNAEVEIYQSSNGYWRLNYANAWITVKRVR